jgi:cytochrome c5
MLKSFLLFTAVVLFLVASSSAPARPPQEPGQGTPAKKMSAEALTKAKRVYNVDCALCHGAAGDGKSDLAKDMQLTLLDWSDPKSLSGKTDQQLFEAIRKGSGKMPPEDSSRAKDDEIRDVVMYIRSFAKEGYVTPAGPATDQPTATPAPTTTPSPSPNN